MTADTGFQSVLFLAQLPPPRHGQSAVSEAVFNVLSDQPDVHLHHLWRGGARGGGDVGKRSLGKYLALASLIGQLIWYWISAKRFSHAYLTMAPWAHTAMRDVVLAGLARALSKRTLIHVHGVGLEDLVQKPGLAGRLVHWCLSDSEIIAVTSGAADTARQLAMFDQVHHVPNFAPRPSTGSNKEHSGDRPLVLGWLGNLDPRKGVLDFVDTVDNLHKAGLSVRGRIGGGSTAMLSIEELRDTVHRRGMDDDIDLLGHLDGAQKSGFFDGIDIFLYPSRHDLAPLVLAEAMAHGAVPIVLDVGGMGEMVGPELRQNVLQVTNDKADWQSEVQERVGAYSASADGLSCDSAGALRAYENQFTPERFIARIRHLFAG